MAKSDLRLKNKTVTRKQPTNLSRARAAAVTVNAPAVTDFVVPLAKCRTLADCALPHRSPSPVHCCCVCGDSAGRLGMLTTMTERLLREEDRAIRPIVPVDKLALPSVTASRNPTLCLHIVLSDRQTSLLHFHIAALYFCRQFSAFSDAYACYHFV